MYVGLILTDTFYIFTIYIYDSYKFLVQKDREKQFFFVKFES